MRRAPILIVATLASTAALLGMRKQLIGSDTAARRDDDRYRPHRAHDRAHEPQLRRHAERARQRVDRDQQPPNERRRPAQRQPPAGLRRPRQRGTGSVPAREHGFHHANPSAQAADEHRTDRHDVHQSDGNDRGRHLGANRRVGSHDHRAERADAGNRSDEQHEHGWRYRPRRRIDCRQRLDGRERNERRRRRGGGQLIWRR